MDLIGDWNTIDPETDHLTRIEILPEDFTGKLLVRIWASCQPEDCFWGETTAEVAVDSSTNPMHPELILEWELETSTSGQRIRLIGKDLLEVHTHKELRKVDIEYDTTDRFKRTEKMGG